MIITRHWSNLVHLACFSGSYLRYNGLYIFVPFLFAWLTQPGQWRTNIASGKTLHICPVHEAESS